MLYFGRVVRLQVGLEARRDGLVMRRGGHREGAGPHHRNAVVDLVGAVALDILVTIEIGILQGQPVDGRAVVGAVAGVESHGR